MVVPSDGLDDGLFDVTSDGAHDGSNEGEHDGKLVGIEEDDIDRVENG